MFNLRLRQQGITLIEVIVAISIISAMVVVIGYSITAFVNARSELLHNTRSVYLAEEGYEILRALRDDSWGNIDTLPVSTTHYFSVSTTTLSTSVMPELIDGLYYRSFELTPVYRDGDDDITVSTTPGATIDPDIFEVTVSVFGPTGTSSVTALLGNIYAL